MFLSLFIEIAPALLYLIGIIISVQGRKVGSPIYKATFWFFLIFLIDKVSSYIYILYSDELIFYLQELDIVVSTAFFYLSLPVELLKLLAILLLVISLFKSLKRQNVNNSK